jgi:hypothetical protein
MRIASCQIREIQKSENAGNALFFELPKFQINGEHQKPDERDAYSQTDLTVVVLFMGFVDERVGALNGLFTRQGHLLERISAERMHVRP